MASSVRSGCDETSVSAAFNTPLVISTSAQNARSLANRVMMSGTRSSSSVLSKTRRRRALRNSTGSNTDVTHSLPAEETKDLASPGFLDVAFDERAGIEIRP